MRVVIGVMGAGAPLDAAGERTARRLGELIAREGWVLLTGGRDRGVMDASSRGAHEAGGLVVGVLPDTEPDGASTHLDIAILTGMRDARNYVNVLSSRVVIALPGEAGTISEVALALKAGRTVIALGWNLDAVFAPYVAARKLRRASSPEDAVALVREVLDAEEGSPCR